MKNLVEINPYCSNEEIKEFFNKSESNVAYGLVWLEEGEEPMALSTSSLSSREDNTVYASCRSVKVVIYRSELS